LNMAGFCFGRSTGFCQETYLSSIAAIIGFCIPFESNGRQRTLMALPLPD
jgi:hypothetical protein